MSEKPPEIKDFADLVRNIEFISDKLRNNSKAPFTDEEIANIKKAAQLVEWFEMLGWLGKQFVAWMGGAVILIMNWERVVEFIGKFRGG